MDLTGADVPGTGDFPARGDEPSLRRRMQTSAALFTIGGILCFVGFLMVASGTASEIPVLGSNTIVGAAFLNPLVPWGIGLIGFGVMLGFFGAATRGPSIEWKDIPPEREESSSVGPRPRGLRYACPACGGDVYTGQAACPTCGRKL